MIENTQRKNFKRVILKLSGEALREPGSEDNISPEIVETVANQIKLAHQAGIEIGIVVGGGNFWRGISASNRGMERATADYVGMLATVMNSLALQSMLEDMEVPTRVQTAIEMKNVAEPFIRRKATRPAFSRKSCPGRLTRPPNAAAARACCGSSPACIRPRPSSTTIGRKCIWSAAI